MEIVKNIGLIIAALHLFISGLGVGVDELKHINKAIFWTLWTIAITM